MYNGDRALSAGLDADLVEGEFAAAKERVTKYLANHPDNGGALLDLLLVHLEMGEPDLLLGAILKHEAAARFAARSSPRELLSLVGFCLFRLEFESRLDALARLAESDTKTQIVGPYLRSLEKTLRYTVGLRQGEDLRPPVEDEVDWNPPHLDRERSIEFDPSELMILRREYVLEGRSVQALQALDRVLELVPKHYPARLLRVRARYGTGDAAGAASDLRQVLEASPWDEAATRLCGSIFRGLRGLPARTRTLRRHLRAKKALRLQSEAVFKILVQELDAESRSGQESMV